MELGVYYTSEGHVIIDMSGQQMVMTRYEAECLFVDLGHVIQDMDINKYVEETTEGEQP